MGRKRQTTAIDLGEQLRQAVRDSGLTQSEISRAIGIGPAPICRFMSGQQEGLQFDHLAKLVELLGLELRKRDQCQRSGATTATSVKTVKTKKGN